MKIGITTYSLAREAIAGRMDVPAMIDFVADNGGEQLELSPGSWCDTANQEVLNAIIKRAKERSIFLSSYTIGANFARPLSETAAEVERVKQQVEIAARLGVKIMRCDAGALPAPESTFDRFEQELPKVADCVGTIADYAAKYGITLTVENHGFLFQNSERVQRLIRTVDRPNYRTTLDVGNFLCDDEDPIHGACNNIALAAQIHFKDFIIKRPGEFLPEGAWITSRSGCNLRGTVIGHGALPVKELAEIIKNAGFDGSISVEFEGPEDCLKGTLWGMQTLQKLFNK